MKPSPNQGDELPGAEAATAAAIVEEMPVEDVPVAPVPGSSVTSVASGSLSHVVGYLVAAAAGVALTLAVLVGSGSLALGSAEPSPTPSPTPAPTFTMDGASVGVASAPLTIEIWADFQCPYCGLMTHGVEPSILREYAATGQALVRYRDFAFLGQESIDAAIAARCAGREGLFWRLHDLLFASQQGENQGAFARDRLTALGKFAGVTEPSFTNCLDDATVASDVAAETEQGRSYGIASTPTLRISGPGPTQLIKGLANPDAIGEAIARASTPAPSMSPGQSPGAGSSGGAAPSASAAP